MPVHEDEQAEWLEWRKGGVTATEVANAATGAYGGMYEVVARKRDLLPPVEQTNAMERGQRWQETIADAVHALTGLYVVGEETWCEHAAQPMHRATVDGFLAPKPDCTIDDLTHILEIKTTGVGVRHNYTRTEAQVQWQMYVTGIPHAVIAVATIDDADDTFVGMRLHRIDADEFAQAELVAAADEIIRHIEAGTLPEPDTATALDAVKAVHMVPQTETVDLADHAAQIDELHELKAQIKACSSRADLLEAQIREAVGDATAGVCEGFKVSVSQPAATLTRDAEAEILRERPDLGKVVLDRDKAKAEAPELYESHRRPLGARRLTIKPTTGGTR